MTTRRVMVAVSSLPAWIAAGYVEVYRCNGGWRLPGPCAVIEWSGIGTAPMVKS